MSTSYHEETRREQSEAPTAVEEEQPQLTYLQMPTGVTARYLLTVDEQAAMDSLTGHTHIPNQALFPTSDTVGEHYMYQPEGSGSHLPEDNEGDLLLDRLDDIYNAVNIPDDEDELSVESQLICWTMDTSIQLEDAVYFDNGPAQSTTWTMRFCYNELTSDLTLYKEVLHSMRRELDSAANRFKIFGMDLVRKAYFSGATSPGEVFALDHHIRTRVTKALSHMDKVYSKAKGRSIASPATTFLAQLPLHRNIESVLGLYQPQHLSMHSPDGKEKEEVSTPKPEIGQGFAHLETLLESKYDLHLEIRLRFNLSYPILLVLQVRPYPHLLSRQPLAVTTSLLFPATQI